MSARRTEGWSWLRRGGYALSLLLALGAAFDPKAHRTAPALEVLIVFDVSLSMAAEDYSEDGLPHSRLAVAKDVWRRALGELPPETRLSVAGFAGRRVQLFLVSHPVRDLATIEAALSVLEWDNVWEVGSRLDRGLWDLALQGEGGRLFSAANRRRILPAPLNVLFFTDGGDEPSPTVPGDAAAWLAEQTRVTFVGVGGTRPVEVPDFTRARPRDCLRTASGECFTSRLNEEGLRALAESVGGRYERLTDAEALVRLLLDDPLTRGEVEVQWGYGWLLGLASLATFFLWSLV